MRSILLAFLLLVIVYGCGTSPTSQEKKATVQQLQLEQILPGVWSIDSAQQLTNKGFYFMEGGEAELVGSDIKASWETENNKQLLLSTVEAGDTVNEVFSIDSLAADRLELHGVNGDIILRKVPFGIGTEQNVLSGFMGKLTKTIYEKSYPLSLPSSKRITIELKSEDPSLSFDLLSTTGSLTPAPLRTWSSVIIIGGDFSLKIKSSDPSRLGADGSEFDVKVFVQ